MEEDIVKKADEIIFAMVSSKDPFEKAALVLKVVPLSVFDDVFKHFPDEHKKKILHFMHKNFDLGVNSIPVVISLNEFVEKSRLNRRIKVDGLGVDEKIQAFNRYVLDHPKHISKLIQEVWLSSL